MLNNVKEDYKSEGYNVDASDFKNLMEYSNSAINRIEALSRIEVFINSQNKQHLPTQYSLIDEIQCAVLGNIFRCLHA